MEFRVARPNLDSMENAIVLYLVMQNEELKYVERRCGFNTKKQCTINSNVATMYSRP